MATLAAKSGALASEQFESITSRNGKLSGFMLEAAGATGGCAGDVEVNGETLEMLSHYYNARVTPIYGGSNEIQRNIVAKQVLKLPS